MHMCNNALKGNYYVHMKEHLKPTNKTQADLHVNYLPFQISTLGEKLPWPSTRIIYLFPLPCYKYWDGKDEPDDRYSDDSTVQRLALSALWCSNPPGKHSLNKIYTSDVLQCIPSKTVNFKSTISYGSVL